MKAIQCVMVVLFTFSLCLAQMVNDGYAKADVKDTAEKSTSLANDKNSDKSKTAKKSDKEAVEQVIPKDIDINSADQETLALLPGIGPAKAEAILQYRKDNGKFKNIEDLTNVKGIGEKTLAKLKPYLKKV